MKGFFLGVFSALMLGQFCYADEVSEYEAGTVKKLMISNPKGEILVVAGSPNAKKIIVTLTKVSFEKLCHFNVEQSPGSLKIAIEHENALFDKASCITKLMVSVPPKFMEIEVTSATAALTFTGLSTPLNFKTATGSVVIKGDVLKNIEGKTATGSMALMFNKCVGRADIDLVSATGDAEITLPSQCKIKVSHKSATGELFNELGESEDYMISIMSKSASGSLKIKKLK